MSLRALLWALYDAPETDPHAKLVLLVLADHAGDDGTGAWPSVARISEAVPCSRSTVQTRLRQLEAEGLILPGDPGLVAHLRADRRPAVWDLPLPERGPGRGPRPLPRGPREGPTGPAETGVRGPRGRARTKDRTSEPYGPAAAGADGAPAGCAVHGSRRPGCADCQRAKPVDPSRIRPTSPEALAAARAAAGLPSRQERPA